MTTDYVREYSNF